MKEERKPIKIRLSMSVIIIVIIMFLSVITIYFLTESLEQEKMRIENSRNTQEQTNSLELKTDEKELKENKEKNENEISKTNKSGIKLTQFDTEFFELEDAALEYRECQEIKNYKDFEYDLDGDGKKDIITIKNVGKNDKDEEYDTHEIKLNDKTFRTDNGYDGVYVYIVDLDKNDKTIQVIVRITGPNDCERYCIYSKDGQKMKNIKEIDSGWRIKLDLKGKFVINNSLLACVEPEIYDNYYELKGNKVEEKKASVEIIKNKTLKCTGGLCFTKDKNSLDKYRDSFTNGENEDYNKALEEYGIFYDIESEFDFEFIRFEDGNWVNKGMYVKLEDGREGYLFSYAYNLAG